MTSLFNNPFVSCTARDMSYSDVMNYWCSPYECYKISEADLVSSVTPIIIEGARGSGKTMILKHLSFFCQKETFSPNKILDSIARSGYLGVYFRYSADYNTLFDSLNRDTQYREALFDNYFQLCIGLEIARILCSLDEEINSKNKENLYSSLANILNEKNINGAKSFAGWIERNIRMQDDIIRKSQYTEYYELKNVVPKTFLFDVIALIQKNIPQLSQAMFIITIDEYENVGDYQRVINTYIKQMEGKGNYTFRIGVRPEGIRDYVTNISDEFLQEGRDYIRKQLIITSDDRTANYRNFVKNVIDKRISMVPIFGQNKISIEDLLGKRENYDWEANYHVNNRKDHFVDALSGKSDEEQEIIRAVISDKSPLIEAYFLMRLRRGESIEKIRQIRQDIASGSINDNTKKYRLDMRDKYKAALLFWLIDKYKAKKMYYGFYTYLYLSCGSIYDFIGLCRTVFDELESDYFARFEENPLIHPVVQTRAAQKYAESQLEKVRINHDYGPQMYRFVQNMCSLFGYYHKGDLCTTYPETNQFFVSGNFDSVGVNKEIWKSLLRWGIIVKKTSYQRASLTKNSRAQLYYINKSYYPIFGISCRIRGGFNFELTNTIWDKMIISMVDPSTIVKSSAKKTHDANKKKEKKSVPSSFDQLTLFDLEGFYE